jgi:hypothetical protein
VTQVIRKDGPLNHCDDAAQPGQDICGFVVAKCSENTAPGKLPIATQVLDNLPNNGTRPELTMIDAEDYTG